MAYADYKLCDVCDGKVFYDSNLSYEDGSDAHESTPYRVAGKEQYEDPALKKIGKPSRLSGRLGCYLRRLRQDS